MWKIFALIIAPLIIFGGNFTLVAAEGEEGSAAEVITYPAEVVKEGAEVVIEAGKNVVETVGETAEGIVTGDVEKAVTTPVKGTVETVVDVVEGTVTAPIDAAKSEEEELHKEDLPGAKEESEVPLAEPVD